MGVGGREDIVVALTFGQQAHDDFGVLVVDHTEDDPDMRIGELFELLRYVAQAVAVMAGVANGEGPLTEYLPPSSKAGQLADMREALLDG